MDSATFAWLLTPAGQEVLAIAANADLRAGAHLRVLEQLRRYATPAQASAAYELALVRVRARTKFPDAERMYFTREAFEQASGWRIAQYRSTRFAKLGHSLHLTDLCCSIGGDALALAHAGLGQIAGVDRDPLRLMMARANAEALDLQQRLTWHEINLDQHDPPATDGLFFDPARRADGRRIFRAADYQPSLERVLVWRNGTRALGIKLAPGIDPAELSHFGPHQLEWISVDGDLKEAVLWWGAVAPTPGRMATLIQGDTIHSLEAHSDSPATLLHEPATWLYEPDPAVLRAGAVQHLAAQIGAAQIDREIAYLTSIEPLSTPFARRWRILTWQPFALKRLKATLRDLDAGSVTVKKRGSPLETAALARQLSGKGSRKLVVVLTFVATRPAVLICEGPC
jgi:hypothetical protein